MNVSGSLRSPLEEVLYVRKFNNQVVWCRQSERTSLDGTQIDKNVLQIRSLYASMDDWKDITEEALNRLYAKPSDPKYAIFSACADCSVIKCERHFRPILNTK